MHTTPDLYRPARGDPPGAAALALALSPEDRLHLAGHEQKLQIVRDGVAGVVGGYSPGLYLHGAGGIGKSYTVIGELRRLRANYVLLNSRVSGRGLYDALERDPDAVHVLEDVEQVARDRNAMGVLRSALWGQQAGGSSGPAERLVTWATARGGSRFSFSGGVILTGNRPLGDLPELAALQTRIGVYHLQPSTAEMRALMRSVALGGHQHGGKRLGPAECLEVCDFVLERALPLRVSLDMRLLVNSFRDRLQWEEGDAASHWQVLVASRLHRRPTALRQGPAGGRAARKQEDLAVVRRIAATTNDRQERLRLWREETGKSEPTLYRRLADLESGRPPDSGQPT